MAQQRRPQGTFQTATAEWKRAVNERMAELDMSRADLAREIGTSPASVSLLLGSAGAPLVTSSTKLMPAIHRALRWPPPRSSRGESSVDELHEKLTQLWGDLDETERAVITMIVARRKPQR